MKKLLAVLLGFALTACTHSPKQEHLKLTRNTVFDNITYIKAYEDTVSHGKIAEYLPEAQSLSN